MTKVEAVAQLNDVYNELAKMDYEPEINGALTKISEAMKDLGGTVIVPKEEPE